MIRKFRENDLDTVMQIWLDTNIKAHSFISPCYWEDNFSMVKELLPQAELYVFEHNQEIQGFIGLTDCYINGIFVRSDVQSQGVGRQLLKYVKALTPRLTLSVYQKNSRAAAFYQREDFKIQCENTDESTGEKEFLMIWEQYDGSVVT